MTERLHILYRFYAADGTLLYVGITINPGARFDRHRGTKSWWGDAVRVELEQHPDAETLREAEREAIKSERPVHNVRMNERERILLDWTCDVCDQPIADGSGYLTISLKAVHDFEAADEAWRQEHMTDAGWVMVSGSDWGTMPEPPSWQTLHGTCDPHPESYDYWIAVERIRTPIDVIHWTAHLLEKSWLTSTEWRKILHRVEELS